ncbi:MAG: DUF2721 domain-containing protein [Burkholderiaceae bacterium]
MIPPLDADTVSHGIQLALAPVFFLTAVSGMIAAVANRLARIVDRARVLDDLIRVTTESELVQTAQAELKVLRKRARMTNACIALLTFCGLLIGLTIIVLFIGEVSDLHTRRLSMLSFLSGVVCFLLALLCFLVETHLASNLLNFGKTKR